MRRILAIAVLVGLMGSSAAAEELFDAEASNETFNRGLTLYFKGDYDGAIAVFEESAQINPENAKAFYFIGYSYYKQKEFAKAGEAFATAYELDKKYSPISP